MEIQFDLCVIGAGMVGASVAWLSRKKYPDWNIALIDRSLAGCGTSLYSASLDIPYGHTPRMRELARCSDLHFREMLLTLPELPIHTIHGFGICNKDNMDEVLQRFTEHGVHIGVNEDLKELDSTFIGLQFPAKGCLIKGIKGRQAFKNEVARTLALEFSKKQNSILMESSEVCEITNGIDHGFHLVLNNGTEIWSERVIQALGPWCNQGPGREHFMTENIRVKKVVAIHIARIPKEKDAMLHFFDDEAFLLPQFESGYWIFSFRSDQWDVRPEVSKLQINLDDIDKAKRILHKYLPDWVNSISGGRVFCDAYTPSGEPLIKQVARGHILAGAGCGSGYRLAPGIADKAIELMNQFEYLTQ